ncbi:CCA tRNA nucleotidyltransferase [Gellertiella hungarica]|uniref:Poly(A) polymerase n=1 Tax=Gellertiella hungarica TaxID=1572859 RepID=A0A7W6J229_9HYPH|nr:CCA tRNA nucleotidyltransferase [Gellertiella hungarica]MBB4063376.1 poly(A) polymerase [Gellertiella hungarica]
MSEGTHSTVSVADEAWFNGPSLRRVMALLNGEGAETRIAGGAVRNSLMGRPVADVDLATTLLPEQVIALAGQAGIKAVPTGIEHGTVTLVVEGTPFEVTTLRRDVATNGRHAEVAFGSDWQEDANRRDLTINGLYADREGRVIDLVGGLPDIERGLVRFIGDAAERVAEDYLRILRFFRFFAHYGQFRPDADGLRACARARDKLKTLSAERIWSELKKLLAAEDPGRALLWMRQAGVLTEILPESEKWGIDAIPGLVATEAMLGWPREPMLRLAAIVPPDAERLDEMARRLRMSRAEAAWLQAFASAPAVKPDLAGTALDRMLYRSGETGVIARLKLAVAAARADIDSPPADLEKSLLLKGLLKRAEAFRKPLLPVSGADLIAAGVAPGPKLGEVLSLMESDWVEKNFAPSKDDLLSRLADFQSRI